MRWSDGVTMTSASGSLFRSVYVAYAIHGAVLRLYGSRSRLFSPSSGICSRTSSLYFAEVTIRMFSFGTILLNLSKV